jgi:tetratricopeptide (TPR) repeat protein
VFWIHASTVARFEEGYLAIANTVKIPGCNDPKADVLQLVKSWLCNESKGKWVMILDNADDVSIFFNVRNKGKETPLGNSGGTTTPLLAAYLPESPNGSILVTTRDEDTACRLTGRDRDIIRIKPMEDVHAVALLQKKLGDEIDKDAATELGAALGFIPLAITQAAAYIRQREPRCSLQLYIRNFHRNNQSKTNLLEYDAGDLRRDLRVSNSVIITWQITFDYICQTRPSAANLLSLMSFFDRQGIPVLLLRPDSGTTNSDGTSSACNDSGSDAMSEYNISNEFEDDIVVLKNFSLITVNVDGDTFEMHSLVQLSTRKWLEENGQLERWKRDYVARLCRAFPPGNYENWKSCQSLFAHAEAAAEQKPTGQKSVMEWALLLYNAGWYAWAKGAHKEAEKMLQKATRAREKFLGQEESETLASIDLLGQILLAQGRYKEAEEMHQRALDGYNEALGQEHPSTLTSVANLASTFWNQGRWKEAEDLDVRVMETRKRVLGQEHPDTLTSIANLASTYRNQGRWKEAEDLDVQVMETSLRVLGQEHPDTLTSIANLASTYWNQGRWKEAEDLEVQVMETRKRVLGQEHPDTLTSIANLASTYRNQGRWKEAEDLEVQVMETRKRVLGQEHPDTLTSIANLASTYWNQGRWKEAEDLDVQAMETSLRVLGQEHPDTLKSMHNFAFTLKSQGRDEKAVALMVQCVNLRKMKLGVDHPSTKLSLKALNEWQA